MQFVHRKPAPALLNRCEQGAHRIVIVVSVDFILMQKLIINPNNSMACDSLMACRISQWAISCQQRPGTGLCDRECECIIKGKLWIIGAECLCCNELIIGDIREV